MGNDTPSKCSIAVSIDDEKTLKSLKALDLTLALVRDLDWDGSLKNGNIVLAIKKAEDLTATQTFTWEETYDIYATEGGFSDGEPVDGSGTPHSGVIDRGQQATLQKKASQVDGEVDKSKPITVANKWKEHAHIVIGCKAPKHFTPFYISPAASYYDRKLIPARSFFIFFASAATEIKTMVDVNAKSPAGHFQITDATKCTVSYDTKGSDPTMYWTSKEGAEKL